MARDIEGHRADCSHFVDSVARGPCWLPRHYSLLTSESVSIATGAGRRRGALGPDDRGKGTLLFDSRKNWRGKREDGGCAGRSNSGTWWHDWKAKDSPSLERERSGVTFFLQYIQPVHTDCKTMRLFQALFQIPGIWEEGECDSDPALSLGRKRQMKQWVGSSSYWRSEHDAKEIHPGRVLFCLEESGRHQ